jgi:N-acetyl-1-D-myo-inositol-2-amino-2-deoxy-alpha-D-glucopyranoside deacetylase
MTPARLLVVTAHPDDEVLHFGGLIHLTAQAGGSVTLLCATRGEVGEIADATLATPATLAAVRESELRTAARLLGVSDLRLLDYRDSGMAGTLDNDDPRAFVRADAGAVSNALVALIREVRPAVVATWAPDGGYGHPDHVAANHHTTAAVARAAESWAPALGEPWATPAVYYAARPAGLRAEVRAVAAARNPAAGPASPSTAAPSVDPLPVSFTLDVYAALDVKKAARAAHRTQTRPDSWIATLPPDLERRFTGTEYFYRAHPAWVPGQVDDLLGRLLHLPIAAPTP